MTKCDVQHTIDYDVIECDLEKGHGGDHCEEKLTSKFFWRVEY